MSAQTYALVVVPLVVLAIIVAAVLWVRHSARALDRSANARPPRSRGADPLHRVGLRGATAAPPYRAAAEQP